MIDLDARSARTCRAGDETATLLGFLEYRRAALAWKCAGGGGLEQLAKHRETSGEQPSLRWILVHMVEEYARHNGHADLLRESVDRRNDE